MKPVKLTVALPTYNRAKSYLPEAIGGILAQTFQDFELLVLDNGSVDNTAQFILELNDPRIRYVRNPVGTSVEFNFLAAYHIALGQRIIVTHDDDVMEPGMLEKQMRFMDEHPDVKLVWTNVRHIDEGGKTLYVPPAGDIRLFGPGEYIVSFPNERLWPLPSTVMMERNLISPRDFELYYYRTRTARRKASNADIAGLADVTFPAFANVKASVGFINEPLLKYRIHTTQYTNKTNISIPGVYLYGTLRGLARRSLKNTSAAPIFNSHIARFSIQDTVCSTESVLGSRTLKAIQGKLAKLCSEPLTPDAIYPVLTVHLLLKILGLSSALDAAIPTLPSPAQHTTAARCLHAWVQAATARRSILLSLEKDRRLVILGSAFISALLILEAKVHGYRIIACLDSNVNRQGRKLLDVPIHAPDWLVSHKMDVDLVVFSSEKDQEANLRELIQRHAGKDMPTLSWKDLIDSSVFSAAS